MLRTVGLLTVMALGLQATQGRSDDMSGPIAWRHDFSKAQAEAKASGKPIVVSVHATWCGPCKSMARTTMRDPKLARILNEQFIPLSIDGSQQSQLVERWQVAAYPTQLVLSPEGKVLKRIEGFVSPILYMDELQRISRDLAAKAPKPRDVVHTTPLTEPTAPANTLAAAPTLTPDSRNEAQNALRTESATMIDPDVRPCDATMPLALDGYCPVAMTERAELIAGQPGHCALYRNERYHFLSEREKSLFEKDPNRYLPVARGDCLVTWVESGRTTRGKVAFPAMFEERVYLFLSETSRRKFLDDPERFVNAYRQHAADDTPPRR